MRLPLLTLAAALAPYALADVEFVTPAAGGTLATGSVTIKWEDSGDSPTIADLDTYTLQLLVGGNTATTADTLFTTTGEFASGNSITIDISDTLAGATTLGFYFKMTSTITAGGTVINYSDRFSIPDMTGTTGTVYADAVTALDGSTAGPATVDDESTDTDTTAAAVNEYTVPYTLQTGLTKYAPMQPVPGSSITAKTYSRLYPTSAYTLATTYMAAPTIVETLTEAQTFSVSSMENTAAAVASNPTADTAKRDMAKYLARWKD